MEVIQNFGFSILFSRGTFVFCFFGLVCKAANVFMDSYVLCRKCSLTDGLIGSACGCPQLAP